MKFNNCKPTLAITLSNNWAIKNYLLSGALAELRNYFGIVAWVQPEHLSGVHNLIIKFALDDVQLIPFKKFKSDGMHSVICKFQKSLLYERYNVTTEKIIKRSGFRGRTILQNFLSYMMKTLSFSLSYFFIDRILAGMRKYFTENGLYSSDFDKYHIDCVFITDSVLREEDAIYYEAIHRSIPIVASILSWDNLTSKGRIHADFSKVLVWNDSMKKEILTMYPQYSTEKVIKVGVPRFDLLSRQLPNQYERRKFLNDVGLNPEGRVILYASCGNKSFPNQNQVIKHISDAIRNREFPADVQLIIRAHPHDKLKDFDEFRHLNKIAVWPGISTSNDKTLFSMVPNQDDLLILYATLKHSSVCVNPASTITLESIACGTPVVNVAYDGDVVLPAHSSIARVFGYSHQIPFLRYQATSICRGRSEMIKEINRALMDSKVHILQRQQVINEFLSCNELSIPRIINSLRSVVEP
jgi:hypothetical protein